MVMHAQVPEFKTKSPVDNYVFQNHCQRGGNVLYLTGEALLRKQYVYVSFKGVSASFFWQRGWDVFSNSKEFVIYKHVPDILAVRHFSQMKCQECTWEQQTPFIWRPISVLLMMCALPPQVCPPHLSHSSPDDTGHPFSGYLGNTYQSLGVHATLSHFPKWTLSYPSSEAVSSLKTLAWCYFLNSLSAILDWYAIFHRYVSMNYLWWI